MNENNKIIDGKYFSQQILSELKVRIELIKARYDLTPTLAIILIGDNPASAIYVRNKLKAAAKIGIHALQIRLPNEVQMDHILNEINKLNNDSDISGIIVQLPLPKHINKNIILSAINPNKDVDGFHPLNVGYLHSDSGEGFVPCTALGCIELLKQVEPNLSSKNVVIIGRSNIVGKPLSALLLREDCTVTICHSHTKNLSDITSHADIVISAMGNPWALTEQYFNSQCIVLDVGISKLSNIDKIVGDVDFAHVIEKVKYISPVPGGVGPMTVAFLMKNTFKALILNKNLTI